MMSNNTSSSNMQHTKLPPLFSKPLPIPPQKKVQPLEPDNSLNPARQRIQLMMTEAIELANKALNLEKHNEWELALKAYKDICNFFKKMMENADSEDLQELLFVHHKYSRRLVIIRNKVEEIRNSEINNNRRNKVSPIITEMPFTFAMDDISSLPSPKANGSNRSLSDPKINLKNNNQPIKSPVFDIDVKEHISPKPKTILKKSSLPSIDENFYKSKPTKSNKTFFGNVLSWDDNIKNTINKNAFNNKQRKSYDTSIDQNNIRCNKDLIAIPESEAEENINEINFNNKVEPKLIKSKPRLGHMPSLPDLSKNNNKQNQPIIRSLGRSTHSTFDNSDDSNSWRESCTLPSNFDVKKINSNSNSPKNPFIFATIQPRTPTTRKHSVDKYSDASISPLQRTFYFNNNSNYSLSSLNETSLDLNHSNNSSSSLTSEVYSMPYSPGPSPMLRSHTAPDNNIRLNTDVANVSRNELPSPESPKESNIIYNRYNISIYQSIWNEEVKSKKNWIPPPNNAFLKVLWQIKCLKNSMTIGSYINSKRIYINPTMWAQTGIKLSNVDLKMEKVIVLSDLLIKLKEFWKEDILGIHTSLEELENVAIEVQAELATKLDFVPSVKKPQKTATVALMSFANKISKSVERIQATYTKDKAYDPSEYINVMVRLFNTCEFLDDWFEYFGSQIKISETHLMIYQKIYRFIEFLGKVIVAFTMHDLSLFLNKYFKRIQYIAMD